MKSNPAARQFIRNAPALTYNGGYSESDSDEELEYQCRHCDRSFSKIGSLLQHSVSSFAT